MKTHFSKGYYEWLFTEYYCKKLTVSVFFLVEIRCGAPPDVSNAAPITSPLFDYGIGETVSYECRVGYEFLTEFDTVVCESDGEWSDTYPVCVGKTRVKFWLCKL